MQKHLFLIPMITLFIFPVICCGASINFEFHFSPPVLSDAPDIAPISIAEAPDLVQVHNWPVMPCKRVLQELPYGARIESITVQPGQIHQAQLDSPLELSAGVRPLAPQSIQIEYPPIKWAEPFPSGWIKWNYAGGRNPETLEYESLLMLTVFPVHTRSQSSIEFTDSLAVEIEYSLPEKTLPQVAGKRDIQEPMIIIAPDDFIDVLNPTILHRYNRGFHVTSYPLSRIYPDYPVISNTTLLRNFIREKVETSGTVFVLLAGDAGVMPVQRTDQTQPIDTQLPMEAYFSDLYNGQGQYHNWDANHDGNFGEYPVDLPSMDLLPDVFISRIPASTPAELQIALDHVIGYENETVPEDEWFNKVIFTAVNTFNEVEHGDTSGLPEGEHYAEQLRQTLFSEFSAIRLYETEIYPRDGLATPENTAMYASQGAGFLAFHCHGAPDCFWLIDQCFGPSDAQNFQNGNKLPFIFGFACSTAAFDNELPDWPYTSEKESMPEHFLLNPDGGGIAFAGATRVAVASGFKGYETKRGLGALEYGEFLAFSQGLRTPGQLAAAAIRYYLTTTGITDSWDFATIGEFAQFGDPAVTLGGINQDPAVQIIDVISTPESGSCILPGSSFNMRLKLLNQGNPWENVTGTLTCNHPGVEIPMNSTHWEVLNPWESVHQEIPFVVNVLDNAEFPGPMTFQISIESEDHRVLAIQSITLFAGNSPLIQCPSWQPYYDSTFNFGFDPDDLIYPALTLMNVGCASADNLHLEVTSSSPWLDQLIYDSQSTYSIPPSSTLISPWAWFYFHINEKCPHGTEISYQVRLFDDDGSEWTFPLSFTVTDQSGPRIFDWSVNDRSMTPGDNLHILARSYDVSGIAALEARLMDDNLEETSLFTYLYDDGKHNDGNPGDGQFGGSIRTPDSPSDFILNLAAIDLRGNTSEKLEASAISTKPIEIHDILFVHNSDSSQGGEKIITAMDTAGLDYDVWDNQFRGPVTVDELGKFNGKTLICNYGQFGFPKKDEFESLAAFAELGGNVMITGWDTARRVSRIEGGAAWLADLFGVSFIGNDMDAFVVAGFPETPVFADQELHMIRKFDSTILTMDKLEPVAPAQSCFTLPDSPDISAGVWNAHVNTRTIFLPFSLEHVKYDDELTALLHDAAQWFFQTPPDPTFQLTVNGSAFSSHDHFNATYRLDNASLYPVAANMLIALSYEDYYWFYPDWQQALPSEIPMVILDPESTSSGDIIDFDCPVFSDEIDGFQFWGILMNPQTGQLMSELKQVDFRFQP